MSATRPYTWTITDYRARLAADPMGYPPNFDTWPKEDRRRCIQDCARFKDIVIAESDYLLGPGRLADGPDDFLLDCEDEPPRLNGARVPFLTAEMPARGYEAPGISKPKMEIEWFSEAPILHLNAPANPLIEDLLDEGALSVIYGDSGSGKTFASLNMGFHVGSGLDWNGKTSRAGLSSTSQRKAASGSSGESRHLAGGDENSSVDMGRIVASADRFRAETGAHFTYVHHTGKDAARGARGHSILKAATDTEIETSEDALTLTKQRDGELGFQIGFKLVDIEIGRDPNGLLIKSAVVEWKEEAKTRRASVKLCAGSQNALDALRYAMDEVGKFPPALNHIPSRTKCVSGQQWKTYLEKRSNFDKPDTPIKGFCPGASRPPSEETYRNFG